MTGRLEGKVAVISGGNSGIGLATAKQFVAEGAVSPGYIDTPGLNNLLASSGSNEQQEKLIAESVPLGRFGRPEEIAKAVVFLASDDSSYMAGAEMFVDGGYAQV